MNDFDSVLETKTWYPGDHAPKRPDRKDYDYVCKLERYADDLERMTVYLTRMFAEFPNQVAQLFEK